MLFLTTGVIAKKLNVDRDVVSYALRRTGVEPVGKAGGVRIFAPAALAVIRRYLDAKSHLRSQETESPGGADN